MRVKDNNNIFRNKHNLILLTVFNFNSKKLDMPMYIITQVP